jgi:hypothetical protein
MNRAKKSVQTGVRVRTRVRAGDPVIASGSGGTLDQQPASLGALC